MRSGWLKGFLEQTEPKVIGIFLQPGKDRFNDGCRTLSVYIHIALEGVVIGINTLVSVGPLHQCDCGNCTKAVFPNLAERE